VDSAGNAHVTGDTPSRDFPIVKALQPTFHEGANFNSFISEINAAGSALIYSTYWGGSGGEGGSRVAVDAARNTYIGGYTFSPDFPTANAIQPTYAGNVDAYLTELSADAQTVIYSTFLGGSGFEYGWDVTVDSAGNAYLTGFTQSTDFPTAHALQPTNHGNTNAFVAKINPSGNAFVFSTYLGGSDTDLGTSIAADSSGNAYVGGYAKSTDFPTAQAIEPTNHGGFDAFVAKISDDGSALLYSTYLGGTANESEFVAGYRDLGIAVDSAGSAYVAGTTKSVDFPITPPAFQQSLKGGADAFVAKIASETPPGPPTNKSQCKKGGWKLFTIPEKFKNQGDCVSFVNTGK
jgi:Beta-propeller repeat